MQLIDNLTEKEYLNFFKKSKYNHFLQSYAWGQTCKVRKQIPIYFGLLNDKGKLVAACMALKKELPLNLCYYYAPRGPLLDYEDPTLLEEFTKELKIYLKKHNAINFRIDPAIMYHEIDEEANPIENGKNNYELFKKFKNLGYKFKGFDKLSRLNQPRYTFRIDTKRSLEDIEKSMNKSFLKTIKRSYNYDLEVSSYYTPKEFYDLMKNIAKKNSFNGNPLVFYEEFDKNFTKYDGVKYISITLYPDKILKKAYEELDKVNKELETVLEKHKVDLENQKNRIEKDIEMFKPYEKKHKDGLLSLILICPHTDRAMWTLYIGNNELAEYTFSVNRAYYEAIKYANEMGYDFLDLYGTCGDPHTEYKNYARIHEYKRKMGGTYTEFIGEYDLINKKLMYIIMPKLMKIYRKIKR